MMTIPAPRLLPATIAAMAALLVLKCGVLLEAVVTDGPRLDGAMVAAANAASSDENQDKARSSEPPPPKRSIPAAAPAAQAAPASGPPGPPPVSESELTLLQDLRQRRMELDARAAAIKTRESLLVAAEQKLAVRVTELQALQQKIQGLTANQQQKEDAGWQGLVKLYEDMKPKDAATIFDDLSMPVLLQLMDRMKDAKAALVMAAMNPNKARDVTAELARLRTGREASGTAAAGPKPNATGG